MVFWNFFCYNCNSFFDFEKKIAYLGNKSKRRKYVKLCPICDSTKYDETVECELCGKKIAEVDTGVCPNCVDEIMKSDVQCDYCKKFIKKEEIGKCCSKSKYKAKVTDISAILDDDSMEYLKKLYRNYLK